MEVNHGNRKGGMPVKNQLVFSDQRKIENRNLTYGKTDAFGDEMYQTK